MPCLLKREFVFLFNNMLKELVIQSSLGISLMLELRQEKYKVCLGHVGHGKVRKYLLRYTHTHRHTRSVWKKSSHCQYKENGLRNINVTWQPRRVD